MSQHGELENIMLGEGNQTQMDKCYIYTEYLQWANSRRQKLEVTGG